MTLTEHRADARHGLATIAVSSAGKYLALKITMDAALMGHIGDPERVALTGTLAEGLWLKPAKAGQGVSTKYATGKSYYLTFGPGPYGAPKEKRKGVEVRAIASAEGIRISGPPDAWMTGRNGFGLEPTKPAPAPNVVRLSSHPGHGELPPPAEKPAKPAAPTEAPSHLAHDITAEIADLSERLRAARDRLEAVTGLRFRFSRDLTLVLSPDP